MTSIFQKKYIIIISFIGTILLISIWHMFFINKQTHTIEPIGIIEEVPGLELFTASPQEGLRGRYTEHNQSVYFEAIRSGIRHPKIIQEAFLTHEYNVEYRFYTQDGQEFFGPNIGTASPNIEWIAWAGWSDLNKDGVSDNLSHLSLKYYENEEVYLDTLHTNYMLAYKATQALQQVPLVSEELALEINLLQSAPKQIQEEYRLLEQK
ncbi:hypothetical protein KKG22_02245 [Patescibacteria group bacterium]|nr:hypothetical protein [Patescibacteria group bacterium]MBU1721827.1 hypothetical protein [Patescibacteria group bacterium]MBU1901678.1 hypothetical protein [Patescibacteria group bacterium]